MDKYLISFLINPISGGELGAKVFKQLPEIMESFGYKSYEWQAQLTEKDRLVEQTQEILSCSEKVIAVGGDGTIGLVLDQLKKQPYGETQIGLIPMGTGNDLARALGIFQVYQKRGLLAVIKRLIRADATKVNLWTVNDTYTLAAYLSLGIDATVVHDFTQAREQQKIWKGTLFNKLYYAKSFITSFRKRILPQSQLEITYHGNTQQFDISQYTCCLLGNINYYAGGAHPFPSMCLNDNALRVLIIKRKWTYLLMISVSRIFPSLSRHLSSLFPVKLAHQVKLKLNPNECLQLDGEDLSDKMQSAQINVQHSHSVSLLDLRRSPFHIFPRLF